MYGVTNLRPCKLASAYLLFALFLLSQSLSVLAADKALSIVLDDRDVNVSLDSDAFARFSGEDIQFLGQVWGTGNTS